VMRPRVYTPASPKTAPMIARLHCQIEPIGKLNPSCAWLHFFIGACGGREPFAEVVALLVMFASANFSIWRGISEPKKRGSGHVL
jgi:hypothetical protein